MLEKLSYFNLFFAVTYALIYFRDSNLKFTLGILSIVIISWLALKSLETDSYKWKIAQYIAACWALYYVGFLLYGTINVAITAFQFDFVSNDTKIFIGLSLTLSIAVLVQIIIYFLKGLNLKEVNDTEV